MIWLKTERCGEVRRCDRSVDVRLREDVEHCDTFWRLRRVQMIQSRHSVDHPKHHRCLHPVIHQVRVGQTSYRRDKSS